MRLALGRNKLRAAAADARLDSALPLQRYRTFRPSRLTAVLAASASEEGPLGGKLWEIAKKPPQMGQVSARVRLLGETPRSPTSLWFVASVGQIEFSETGCDWNEWTSDYPVSINCMDTLAIVWTRWSIVGSGWTAYTSA